ncbi:DUF6279 family lipoprotein [Salinivibrio socompensis]|uniref:DUF6279 family lipoprotein n=1 Tax=Salinivibrio socompensis TaxID=1510206 RepID=UPI00046FE666|nr:DUF6279 family lipoprotein [Salinivibrio socompensis]
MVRDFWLRCRSGCLAGCLLVLVGCSTELAYNTLPFWIHYYIDDIVDLTATQSQQVKADLDTVQQWHRAEELPRLADRLTLIAAQSSERQTWDQLRDHQAAFKARMQAILHELVPTTTRLLQSLDDRQAERLTQFLKDEIAEAQARRDKRSSQEWLSEQQEELEERTERWVGHTKDSQAPFYAEMAEYQQRAMPTFIAVREQLQARLFNLIEVRQRDDLDEQLYQWVDDLVAWRGGTDTQTDMAIYRSRRLDWLLRFEKSLDDDQRTHLREELVQWASRLRRMAE